MRSQRDVGRKPTARTCRFQLGTRLLPKLARRLQFLYRFLLFLIVYNNLGHLLFARKLTPLVKTHRVLKQF